MESEPATTSLRQSLLGKQHQECFHEFPSRCSFYVKDIGHLSGYTLHFLLLLDQFLDFLFYSNNFQQPSKEEFSNHLSYL